MRRIILFILVTLAVAVFSDNSAYSVETYDQTPAECSRLTNEDAANALKESFPNVKVLEVRPAQVNGLIEVAVESNGQKGVVYLDCSKRYLVSGSILDLKTRRNFTQERSSELNKVEVSQIPLDDALVMGDKDAKHRVIVFDDPE